MMSELYSVSQMSLTDVSPGASVHFEKNQTLWAPQWQPSAQSDVYWNLLTRFAFNKERSDVYIIIISSCWGHIKSKL